MSLTLIVYLLLITDWRFLLVEGRILNTNTNHLNGNAIMHVVQVYCINQHITALVLWCLPPFVCLRLIDSRHGRWLCKCYHCSSLFPSTQQLNTIFTPIYRLQHITQASNNMSNFCNFNNSIVQTFLKLSKTYNTINNVLIIFAKYLISSHISDWRFSCDEWNWILILI